MRLIRNNLSSRTRKKFEKKFFGQKWHFGVGKKSQERQKEAHSKALEVFNQDKLKNIALWVHVIRI